MGDKESLSTYSHYWKYSLVPHLMLGKINNPFQLEQGWNCHQADFWHSDFRVSTDGDNSLMLLTPTNMILHPGPYTEVPNQPWNPMLDIVNLVNTALKINQLEQPEETEAWVYGSKFEVWPYDLFTEGKMSAKVRAS